jgi:hypothetical protein
VTIALDLGASRFRTLRRAEDRLVARSVEALYSVLADTPAHRRLLDQAGIPFALSEGNIVLLGKAATESASLFRESSRRLLPDGRVPTTDPLGRQLVSCLIEAVLPVAAAGGEICSVALPSGIALEASESRADAEFYSRIVQLQGYESRIVPAAQSLILAELANAAFTGIGLVFGASGCEAVLAHRGQPLCHAQTKFGGHAIDDQLLERGHGQPSATSDAATAKTVVDEMVIQRLREEVIPSERSPSASIEHAVASSLRQTAEKLIAAFDAELRRTPRVASIPQPVAVICSGGLTETPGFEPLIADVIGQCRLPVKCQIPRVAASSARSVLRGLLISGELESPSDSVRRSA